MFISQELAQSPLSRFQDLIDTDYLTFLPDAPLPLILRAFAEHGPEYSLYVVDKQKRFLGAVHFASLVGVLFPCEAARRYKAPLQMTQKSLCAVAIARDLMDAYSQVPRLGDTVADLAQLVVLHRAAAMPLTDENGTLLGKICLHRILSRNASA